MLPGKVGKQRGFWRGLLLTVVTLGIYGIYWNYQAHKELHRQFEMGAEGRSDAVLWLIFGVIFGLPMLVYHWKFVNNVNHARWKLGMKPGITPLAFLLWTTVGVLLLVVVGPAIGYYQLQNSVNEVWDQVDRQTTLAPSAPTPAPV